MKVYLVENVKENHKIVYKTLSKVSEDLKIGYRTLLNNMKEQGFYFRDGIWVMKVDFIKGKKTHKNENIALKEDKRVVNDETKKEELKESAESPQLDIAAMVKRHQDKNKSKKT